MTDLDVVVYKSSHGGWGVKPEGALKASIHTNTKMEAIKMGRALSIKRGGKLEVIEESLKDDSKDNNHLDKEVYYG